MKVSYSHNGRMFLFNLVGKAVLAVEPSVAGGDPITYGIGNGKYTRLFVKGDHRVNCGRPGSRAPKFPPPLAARQQIKMEVTGYEKLYFCHVTYMRQVRLGYRSEFFFSFLFRDLGNR